MRTPLARNFLVDNLVFGIALSTGAALRLITMLGFRPAIWSGGDSASYVTTAVTLYPGTSRVSGYGIFLFLLRPFHSFTVVTAVAHLAGLAIAVFIYALLRRCGLPGWGATLAALPVLLDAYQIQLEHEILANAVFGFLVMAAITLLLWWRGQRPLWATATAALLLGLAATMWPVGLPVVVLFLAYLLLRRAGWRAFGAALIAVILPVGAYLSWFDVRYHQVALSYADGIFLWSRTMTFADCAIIKPPADELALCPRVPVAQRLAAASYIWRTSSPINALPGPEFSRQKNALARNFALRAITAQPGAYVHDVLDDFALTFTWNRPDHPSVEAADRFQFAFATNTWVPNAATGERLTAVQRAYTQGSPTPTRAVEPFAGFMRGYQRYVYLRGTFLGILLLIGAAAIVRSWAGGGFRRRASWGGPALFPWVTAVAMLLVPNVTADFTERYALPALPLVCLAAALAFARPGPAIEVAASSTVTERADGRPGLAEESAEQADGRPEQADGSQDRQVVTPTALAQTQTASSRPARS
jgi:hypothetical protein